MKFKQVVAGEWQQPIRRGYKMACCDCGLVHRLNFRLVKRGKGNLIQLQAFRDGRISRSGRLILHRTGEVELAANVTNRKPQP